MDKNVVSPFPPATCSDENDLVGEVKGNKLGATVVSPPRTLGPQCLGVKTLPPFSIGLLGGGGHGRPMGHISCFFLSARKKTPNHGQLRDFGNQGKTLKKKRC